MKIKMLKIFTIIACAYLVLSAISGTIIQFPKFLVLRNLDLLNLQLIPLSTSTMYSK